MEHSQMNAEDLDSIGDAIKALGSLFKLTQVFLRDDASSWTQKTSPIPQHIRFTYDSSDGDEAITSNITSTEFTVGNSPGNSELTRKMSALGLPLSFNTSKKKSTDAIKGKRKGTPMVGIHDRECDVLEIIDVSEEDQSKLFYSSVTMDGSETPCDSSIKETDITFTAKEIQDSKSLCSDGVPNDDVKIQLSPLNFDAEISQFHKWDRGKLVKSTDAIKGKRKGTPMVGIHDRECDVLEIIDVSEEDQSKLFYSSVTMDGSETPCDSSIKETDITFTAKEIQDSKSLCSDGVPNDDVKIQLSPLNFDAEISITSSLRDADSIDQISRDGGAQSHPPKFFVNELEGYECTGRSGVWKAYWDSYYMRNYFFNIETLESTWYAPSNLEHLAFSERGNKPYEMMVGELESMEKGTEKLSSDQISYENLACSEHNDTGFLCNVNINKHSSEETDSHETKLKDHNCERNLQLLPVSVSQRDIFFGNPEENQKGGSNDNDDVVDLVVTQVSDSSRMVAVAAFEDDVNGNLNLDWTCVSYKLVSKQKKKRRKKRVRRKSSSGDKGHLLQGMWEELSCDVKKYWCQRYLLFSKFDDGIKMDEEGWYSVTPECIARHIAIRCGCGIIVDCFTGVGGNAIQFAERCQHVVAIDIDPMRIDYARHNASLYGVDDQIDFINGDFFHLATKLKGDTVFLSPPWGGPDYARLERYDLHMLMPRDGRFLFDTAKQIASKIVMFLPKNIDVNQLAELSLSCTPPWSLEVEENFLNDKLKTITAYFSDQPTFESNP